MKKTMPGYQSFLLRLWLVRESGQMNWRASLESPQNGAHYNFVTLDALFDFLTQQTNQFTEAEVEKPP